MAASLYLAFTDYDILTAPRWVGLENFQRMFFEDRRYLQSVTVTLFYVAVAVPLRLAFALALAMLLNTQRRGHERVPRRLLRPSIVAGSVAVALMWRQVFGTQGVVNAVLALAGRAARELARGSRLRDLDPDHAWPSGSSARRC